MSFKAWKSSDNTDRGEKVTIRHRLLSMIENPSVLECYAGEGKIYQACYHGLPYLGIDSKPIRDGRPLITIDNRKYLRSADLTPFNVFDLDAYGSPWHQFLIILRRRCLSPRERIAVALTDGLDFKMRMSGLPDGMRPLLNIPPRMNIPCLNAHHEFIAKLIVKKATAQAGLFVELFLSAQNPRGDVYYFGLIISKKV